VTASGGTPMAPEAPQVVPPPGRETSSRRTGGSPGGGESGAQETGSARWRPDAELYLSVCRVFDGVATPAFLVVAFLLTNFPATFEGLQEFLGLRVTVKNLLYVLTFAVGWRAICGVWRVHDWRTVRQPRSESLRLIGAVSTAAATALVFPAISVTGAFSLRVVLGFWLGSAILLPLSRIVFRRFALWREGQPHEVLIVGTGRRAMEAVQNLSRGGQTDSHVVGFLDSHVLSPDEVPAGALLGTVEELERILMRTAVDEVLIALPIKSCYEDIQLALEVCERVGVRATYLADVFQSSQARPRLEGHEDAALVAMLMAPDDHRLVSKRVIDVVVAAVGLVVLSPILLAAALVVKLSSPGPVFFVQSRYGFNRRRFKMLKFRTMVNGAEHLQAELEHLNENTGPTFKIRDDPRMTTVGRWLRRASIDELPQLLNVCRGDMSLVGPRPLPERDVHRFSDAALMRRFSVRPGITCLWQIRGRSDVDFDQWITLDLEYIDRWSLGLDLSILLRTVPVVLRGRGAV
jgi:exopolysaccharide biosynthesis polyprenyl glycosylphosphotransferase